MKFFKRFLVVFVAVILLSVVAAWLYVRVYGRTLIEAALNDALRRDVAIEKISYRFPLGVKVHNISVAQPLESSNSFKVKNIIAQLSWDTLLEKKWIFDSIVIVEPSVAIETVGDSVKEEDDPDRRYGVLIPPQQPDSPPGTVKMAGAVEARDSKGMDVFVREIVFQRGRFQYANRSINKNFFFALEDVFLKVHKLVFPLRAQRTDFHVLGRLVKEGNPLSGSSVKGGGWIDIISRDMEVEMEVVEEDGSVGMTAQAISQSNDMDVTGEVKFQNLLTNQVRNQLSQGTPMNDLITNTLASSDVKIGAQFSFKTKMDNFRPEQVSFSGKVVTK